MRHATCAQCVSGGILPRQASLCWSATVACIKEAGTPHGRPCCLFLSFACTSRKRPVFVQRAVPHNTVACFWSKAYAEKSGQVESRESKSRSELSMASPQLSMLHQGHLRSADWPHREQRFATSSRGFSAARDNLQIQAFTWRFQSRTSRDVICVLGLSGPSCPKVVKTMQARAHPRTIQTGKLFPPAAPCTHGPCLPEHSPKPWLTFCKSVVSSSCQADKSRGFKNVQNSGPPEAGPAEASGRVRLGNTAAGSTHKLHGTDTWPGVLDQAKPMSREPPQLLFGQHFVCSTLEEAVVRGGCWLKALVGLRAFMRGPTGHIAHSYTDTGACRVPED